MTRRRPDPAPTSPAVATAPNAPEHKARGWARLWQNAVEYSTGGTASNNLWVRWLVLRAVGLVYVIVFAGIVAEGKAILGPTGLAPAASLFQSLASLSAFEAFLRAPTLFWLNSSAAMIAALTWIGFLAAVAVVLNLWPRLALSVCWVALLSFVAAWGEYTPAQLDSLMLETALLCIPFAPAGRRPGLGAHSPPRPITMFMMRWLFFRIMFGSGVVKILSDDGHWRSLTAMDVMYETSPSPTIVGYWVHQLPHAYHLFEIAVTFVAEIVGPLLALLGGRRGRWWAFAIWIVFQTGIQLSCNFGWLNTAAIGMGLLLLDDRMLAAAANKLRWRAASQALANTPQPERAPPPGWLGRYALPAALGLHFAVTLYYSAVACGLPDAAAMKPVAAFRSANGYYLYAGFGSAHYMIDFEGSNDGGRTWRTYPYRHLPQFVDRAPRFTAPWFPRFENTVFFESERQGKTSVIPATALKLLARHPDVMHLFAGDPFPDRPPTVIRMRRYRLVLTDVATHRRTGHYWRKEFAGDYLPGYCLLEGGKVAQFDLADAEAAITAGNYPAARSILELQYTLGNLDAGWRLADLYSRGQGAEPARIFALFSELADRGEIRAIHSVGVCYEQGVGVPIDYPKAAAAYRRAAEDGSRSAMLALGALHARDLIIPRDNIEGLSWLLTAATRAKGEDPVSRLIREQEPAHTKRLMERMSPTAIASARAKAASREPVTNR
jgi:TPR repeat protein